MALERKYPIRHSGSRQAVKKRPPVSKYKTCCLRFTAFIFSHVGLSGLVVGYSIMGAFAFRALEAPNEEKKVGEVTEMREQTVKRLWDITYDLNVLYKDNWTGLVAAEIKRFQSDLIAAVKEGYDGKELGAVHQWSFSGSLLYCLTVITTIGARRPPGGVTCFNHSHHCTI
ncbi:TWiK family of potassium channels protein 7-like, partial [Limulus polyphemus]|uniref:TWiK family of potassium channels protein 7-like n=1 Tax=Limulus polyphemus TaxID=6850 RepID=A0ABM1B5U0_LIMPO